MMAALQMSSAFVSSSKPFLPAVPFKKYGAFLSFQGEDTRSTFTSHLYEALKRNKVETFIDNKELKKGDEISPALNKAIEDSDVSIVTFSENYASSKWCLDELVKIVECKKGQRQIVIPVFHNIDPSHVRKQTGSYEQAFAKHEQDLTLNKDKLQKWKSALTEVANLAGWDSQNYSNESELIKDIVKDVVQKLTLRYMELLGIENKKELMRIVSNDDGISPVCDLGGLSKNVLAIVLYAAAAPCQQEELSISLLRMVSVGGTIRMCGLGKNALAFIALDGLCLQFEVHCYLANVRGESNKCGLNALRKKLFSTLLEEEDLRLVVLCIPICMPRSKLKKLWDVVQNLVNLEMIELWYSKDLIDVPDLSMAQKEYFLETVKACESFG